MSTGIASIISGVVALALTVPAVAGPTSFSLPGLSGRQMAGTESVSYRCHRPYVWFPDGTIAGATAGYPYYGWYGYPYVPYRCVRVRAHRYHHHHHSWRAA
jgi:hypothetical protein